MENNFENFLAEYSVHVPQSRPQPNKLRSSTNYVPHYIFEHIDEIDDYDQCIAKLEALYCKPPNKIFSRYSLVTRRQQPEKSIGWFLVALKKLSKDCNFKTVTAVVYQDELIRDILLVVYHLHILDRDF